MATIEIRIRSLAQLFESPEPEPFRENTLEHDAESYIVEFSSEFAPRADLHLRI